MSRYTGPKNKLARREGVDLGLKTVGTKAHAKLLKRINIIPGMKKAKKFNSKQSDYGKQLREKQKIKRIYGVAEKSMKHYFEKAVKTKGNTGEALIHLLEHRLDNIVYRLHMAPTRTSARQLVNHGHMMVDGNKVSIPSYEVSNGAVITFRRQSTCDIPYIKVCLEEKNITLPSWLKRSGAAGEVAGMPHMDEYQEPVNLALVIEYYSKL